MLISHHYPQALSFQSGQVWASFEQFRLEGGKALSAVKDGTVATLHTKSGQYRILEEHDFQKLFGLARDIDRLRGGLRVVTLAVRAVQKHPDAETLNVLAEAVAMLGSLPELPVRERFEALLPEGEELEPDDEVILDPIELKRLSQVRKAEEESEST